MRRRFGSGLIAGHTYDANGNIWNDKNKGITSNITYNYLNLPELVTRGGNTVQYIYDATGRKLAQKVTYAGATKRTDYLGEFVYENDVLQFINHEEGRIVVSGEKLLLRDGCENTGNKTASNATLATHTAKGEEYVKVTANGTTVKTGVFPIGGSFPVTPGERYRIRAKGYRTGANAVYLLIKANTTDLGWPGAALPSSEETEAWTEQVVTIPGGASTLQAGVAWNTVTNGEIFYLNEFEIVQLTATDPEYQYHLKDHLGNVRVTFTSKEERTDTYTATLENDTQAEEQTTFKNYSRVANDIYDHTDAGTTYDKAQLLNGGNNSQVGLTKSIAVMPGDVVSVEVYAKYFEDTGGSGNLSGFAAALLSAFGLPTPAGGEAGTAAAALQDYGAFIAGGGNSGEPGWPKGWLNMLVFDKDYNLVDIAFEQVNSTFGQPIGNPNKLQMQELTATKTIKEPGYVYIYLSNEGNVQQDIYFDDLKITHEKTRVIQMDDYYPFGLTFNSSRRENSVTNAYQYNGKEMQDELGLGMLDYGARMYMSDIGRWGVIDPLTEKARRWSPYTYVYDNPLRFIDPDGMEGMGTNPHTGGSLGEGNLMEHRRWMDERDERFAKRRMGAGSYSGSSEMEQRVLYWGSPSASNNVHPRTKKNRKKRLSTESNEKEAGMSDITEKFYQQLARTELFYTLAKEIFDETDFTVPGNEYIEKLRFFANTIGHKKLFDIKQPGKGFSEEEIGLYSIFEGSEYHFTAYGNINYGYAARIFGFSLNVALKAAGLNQVFGNGEGEPNWGNLEGLFDEYTDSDMIKKGYNISLPWD